MRIDRQVAVNLKGVVGSCWKALVESTRSALRTQFETLFEPALALGGHSRRHPAAPLGRENSGTRLPPVLMAAAAVLIAELGLERRPNDMVETLRLGPITNDTRSNADIPLSAPHPSRCRSVARADSPVG